jgi:hypothetical protein
MTTVLEYFAQNTRPKSKTVKNWQARTWKEAGIFSTSFSIACNALEGDPLIQQIIHVT